MKNMFVVFLTAAFFHASLVASVEYSYNTSDNNYGPNAWAKAYPVSCNGTRQSPINIEPAKATYDGSLGKLTLAGFDSMPNGAVTSYGNNGKSFRVFFKPNMFNVSGGGLPGTFYTHNIHFHWGADNTKGSEHTIDGKKFPLELHFVNVNQKYANASQALAKADGIAALGVIYEVGAEDTALQSYLKYTANVTYVKDIDVTTETFTQALKTLLPTNTDDFYRYDGSLTTPICQESVTWTVFKTYRTVSIEQLNMLRGLKLKDNTTMLVDTFRPVLPLGSRVVKKTFGATTTAPPTTEGSKGETYHVANIMTIIASLVMATVMSK